MKTVNIHEAKTHLSRLVDAVVRGGSLVIAKAGTPLVRLVPVDTAVVPKRTGFLEGEIEVPKDFDRLGTGEILTLFGLDG